MTISTREWFYFPPSPYSCDRVMRGVVLLLSTLTEVGTLGFLLHLRSKGIFRCCGDSRFVTFPGVAWAAWWRRRN